MWDHRIASISLSLCVVIICVYIRRKMRRRVLPPGLPKLPILGNFFNIPVDTPWKAFVELGKKHNSDILHFSALGKDFIVLNSYTAAVDLLDHRSAIYSSRPRRPMINEVVGWKWVISAMPYGEQWRQRRQLFAKFFGQHNSDFYRPRQMEFNQKMLLRILDYPDDLIDIVRQTIIGVAISLAYGLPLRTSNDPHIERFRADVATRTSKMAIAGQFLVEYLPSLQYLPKWAPGAGFKTKVEPLRKLQEEFRNATFNCTVDELGSGTLRPALVSDSLEALDETQDSQHQREVIRDTAGIVSIAAGETTLSVISTFLLAMTLYPEIQSKAQEELSRVSAGHIPRLGDKDDYPYTSAVIKEVLRWQPPAPLGSPHMVTEADHYKGYFIPGQSTVFANIWAMCRDENHYSDADTFNPERFLKDGAIDSEVLDPAHIVFGFGRRLCPGIYVAESMLWITIVSLLSLFNISKALDADGNAIIPDVHYEGGVVRAPQPFKCTVKPRSEEVEALIRAGADDEF